MNKKFSLKFWTALLAFVLFAQVGFTAESSSVVIVKKSSSTQTKTVVTKTEKSVKEKQKKKKEAKKQAEATALNSVNVVKSTETTVVNSTDTIKDAVALSSALLAEPAQETSATATANTTEIALESAPSNTSVSSSTLTDVKNSDEAPKATEEKDVVSSTDTAKSAYVTPKETKTSDTQEGELFDIEKVVIPPQPNYAKKTNWAILPDGHAGYKVDVFYVYPTIFAGNGYELMDVQDKDLRTKAKNYSVFNTGIFEGSANIYAPYYRQMSISILNLNAEEMELFGTTSLNDVKTAFKYYLKYYNDGKPFILAGFSQGSILLIDLMKEMFADPELQKKLIAAYIIGYSVTETDLAKYPFLKAAKSADDTGVIISYNTQIANSGYSKVLHGGSVAINPITWKTDNKSSKEKQYKGAVLFDIVENKTTDEPKPFTSAYLEKETNALVVDADIQKYNAATKFFTKGSLHMYDYMFFYNNLKENAKNRITRYLKNNK